MTIKSSYSPPSSSTDFKTSNEFSEGLSENIPSYGETISMGKLQRLFCRIKAFFTAESVQQNLKGIFWKVSACFGFALVNTCVRYLTGGAGGIDSPLPASVVVLFQNIFGCLVMLPFVLKDGVDNLKTTKPFTHAVRVISAVIGIICLYTAFANMPMAQVVALQFTGPVFTVIGAKLYLKEHVGAKRILGIFLGMVGAYILTRPDKAFTSGQPLTESLVVFLPLISAALFVIAKLCARNLGKRGEKPQLLALYLLFFMIPVSGTYAASQWIMPSISQLGMLFVLGASGSLAHYATAKSYTFSEVMFLTPFGFTRLILTGVLGYCLFGEFPKNEGIWIAVMSIIASVMVITWAENKRSKQDKKV